MPRTGGICLLFLLAAVRGTLAAAADLPRQGTFAVALYGVGTWKGAGVGKNWFGSSFEEDGVVVGDELRHAMTAHCYGIGDRIGVMRSSHGHCINTDPDGNKVAFAPIADPYPTDAKDFSGHAALITGTDKYEGITGELNYTCHVGIYRPAADNAFVATCVTQGTYKLP